MKGHFLPRTVLIAPALAFFSLVSAAQSVDLLTGRAQVSIPIWTLSYGDLTVPISVWHHGGALRVEEGDGACGMGWNLSVGGAVSRYVRGLPDDYKEDGDDRRGWLLDDNALDVHSFTNMPDDYLSNCTDEELAYSFVDGRGRIMDTEPDIFYFSAPGLSGQFVFGTDGNPKLLTYQDVLIEVTKAADRIAWFDITTNLGIKYTFSNLEYATRQVYKKTPIYVSYFRTEYLQYQQSLAYTGTWHLTSITSAATGKTATFNYEDGAPSEGNRFVISIPPSDNIPDTLYYVRDEVAEPQQLSSITMGGYTASISWYNNLVRRISITESAYSNARQFDFVYQGFRSSTNTTGQKIHHYFLKEIKQLYNCVPKPDYSFTYDGVSLGGGGIGTVVFPWETKFKQDFWGYFNGGSTNKNIPKNYFYSTETDSRRLRTHPISGPTLTSSQSGDDREVNPSVSAFGALTEINYPYGGQTKFTYEPNVYFDPTVNRSYLGGGVRVSKVFSSGGDVAYGRSIGDKPSSHAIIKEYLYKLTNDSSSGVLTYPTRFAFATDSGIFRTPYQLGNPSEVLYSRVVEKVSGKGKTVYDFDLPDVFPNSAGTGSKIARAEATLCATEDFKNGVYTFPFAPHKNVDRGYLKKQSEYSENNDLVREKRLTYTNLGSELVVSGLRFERISNGYHFSKYSVRTGTVKVIQEEVSKEIGEENAADSIKTTISYTYNSNNMLETVTKTNHDGSVTKEKIRYVKDYASIGSPPSTDIPEFAIKEMLAANRHGEVVERISKLTPAGGSEKVVNASIVLYKKYSNDKVLPIKFLSYPPVGTFFFQSDVSSGKLRYDTSYFVSRTIDNYDNQSNITSESDYRKNIIGYHPRNNFAAPPAATFANCFGSEAVSEDFEACNTDRGFTTSGGSIVSGYTGSDGYQLGTLTSGNVEKRGSKYRVSLWAKASQSTTLTFKAKNGSTEVSGSTTELTYDANPTGQWLYVEKVMDVSNASSPFTLVLTANASITVDDVVALPETASASLNTYRPLVGITSESDDRGNSVVYTYDSLGRKQNTFDRKRNLVENKVYESALPKLRKLSAAFTGSVGVVHRKGQSSTFTAVNITCIEGIAYSWEIYSTGSTPVATSANSSISYSFGSIGPHSVRLTVSHALYDPVTYAEEICVREPVPTATNLSVTGGSTVYSCNGMNRTFHVVHPPSGTGVTVKYTWFMKRNSASGWDVLVHLGSSSSISVTSPFESYSMKCQISVTYAVVDNSSCTASSQPSPYMSSPLQITYVYNGPCP